MAIGAIHIAWLSELHKRGQFRGPGCVIDLGPQDVQVARNLLAGSLPTSPERTALMDGMFSAGPDRPDAQCQKAFYALYGFDGYESLDSEDPRATYKVDLNLPAPDMPEFEVVTNFGTTEHVCNIGEAFKTVHRLTKPGGLSLHAVPCFAFINHGFYGINPNVLVEIALANRYEIVDFSYYDNAYVRNVQLDRGGLDGFRLDALPIRLEDMEDTTTFMSKVVDRFYANLVSKETCTIILDHDRSKTGPYPGKEHLLCFVFDLVFFAMRRPLDRSSFVFPMQRTQGVVVPKGA